MNLAFEGVVASNQSVVAIDEIVPAREMWRLSLLTIKHSSQHIEEHEHLASPPGTLIARLFIAIGGDEERLVYTFSGDHPFIRQPLHSVLESGDGLRVEIGARHHGHPCAFEGVISVERRSITEEAVLRVEVTNLTPDDHYLHFQPPATTWMIPHMLGRYPHITTVDSLGREIEGSVTYIDPNYARVDFAVAVGGSAFCS